MINPIFLLPQELYLARVRVAIELPAGVEVAGGSWAALPLLSWLPLVSCSSEAPIRSIESISVPLKIDGCPKIIDLFSVFIILASKMKSHLR